MDTFHWKDAQMPALTGTRVSFLEALPTASSQKGNLLQLNCFRKPSGSPLVVNKAPRATGFLGRRTSKTAQALLISILFT